jgi:hypothetical protein
VPAFAGIFPEGCKVDIKEIDILWITAGLGCDGDTIAMADADSEAAAS